MKQLKLMVGSKECWVNREHDGVQYLEVNQIVEHRYIINDMRDGRKFIQYIYLSREEADNKWTELTGR